MWRHPFYWDCWSFSGSQDMLWPRIAEEWIKSSPLYFGAPILASWTYWGRDGFFRNIGQIMQISELTAAYFDPNLRWHNLLRCFVQYKAVVQKQGSELNPYVEEVMQLLLFFTQSCLACPAWFGCIYLHLALRLWKLEGFETLCTGGTSDLSTLHSLHGEHI